MSGPGYVSESVVGLRGDDDRRWTAAGSWGPYRHRDEEADPGSRPEYRHAEDRHAGDRRDKRPDGDEDRHHDGHATCCTRFHALITS